MAAIKVFRKLRSLLDVTGTFTSGDAPVYDGTDFTPQPVARTDQSNNFTANQGINEASPDGALHVASSAAAAPAMVVEAHASQSTRVFEIRESSGSLMLSVGADGSVVILNQDIRFLKNITFSSEYGNGNSGTSKTVDWTNAQHQNLTLTGNATLSFTDPAGPTSVVLKIVQDATGSRTVTWPASVKWPGGTAPTLSTGASAEDLVRFYFDGTNYYAEATLNYS